MFRAVETLENCKGDSNFFLNLLCSYFIAKDSYYTQIYNLLFYCIVSYFQPGAFENAVDECKSLIRNDLDGEIKGAWVLTE